MNISARNTFPATVSHITIGPVSAEVALTTSGGDRLVATITQSSATSLGLSIGTPIVAIVKASSVMVMTDSPSMKLSARNCLAGVIKRVTQGPVSAEVIIALPGGTEVFASITRDAVVELGLREGVTATAVIKSSSVILGVPA
ncbi:TOBE domain-containing protein [Viridibacterium curvum]|uniref:Mop domain-containing protein n=1 Tax=Viridibacterium curvum TaxID=1101404 RepID=A0ABP9R5T4_9RHOO